MKADLVNNRRIERVPCIAIRKAQWLLLLLLKVRPYTKIRYLLLWRRRSHVLLILLDRVKEIYQVWSRTLRLWFRGYCLRGF